MLKKGNGRPEICVFNLLRTFKGEVCYDRFRGLDPRLIDTPACEKYKMLASAEQDIKIYEPRASMDSTQVQALMAEAGAFALNATVENKGGE